VQVALASVFWSVEKSIIHTVNAPLIEHENDGANAPLM
jgi:hypothetical protein